jgi:AraC-like DNA-binding protein
LDWDLDFRQLQAGSLAVNAILINTRETRVLGINFNRGLHQKGSAPAGMLTFGISDHRVKTFTWCRQAAWGGQLLNFNLESGFDAVSPPGFGGYTFSWTEEALDAHAETLGLSDHLRNLRTAAAWKSRTIPTVSGRLGRLLQQADLADDAIRYESEILHEEVARRVLLVVAGAEFLPASDKDPGHRAQVLSRALECLDEPINLPITVHQLCLVVGTSESTLRRVFVEQFGILPKAYIRARCLSAVRDELSLSPSATRVADVANRWGFWHMGQFARDFRKMFGLLPSQCLSN